MHGEVTVVVQLASEMFVIVPRHAEAMSHTEVRTKVFLECVCICASYSFSCFVYPILYDCLLS